MTCASVASPGRRATDARSVACVDHVTRFGFAHDAEADAQVGVRSNICAHHTFGSLRREYQVHAEGSAALSDSDETADEVGELFSQGREFVDHDDQSRKCSARRRGTSQGSARS